MARTNRKRRRAIVKLTAERILTDKGEMAISDLTRNIRNLTEYDINTRQVAIILKSHPRIIRHTMNRNRSSYSIGNPHNPPMDA
ncbi:MAG: hypothetical protein GY845_33925 [Planctomycetes bacterium]|nr:hypothetical protein [Planctomycetota bacterium]